MNVNMTVKKVADEVLDWFWVQNRRPSFRLQPWSKKPECKRKLLYFLLLEDQNDVTLVSQVTENVWEHFAVSKSIQTKFTVA